MKSFRRKQFRFEIQNITRKCVEKYEVNLNFRDLRLQRIEKRERYIIAILLQLNYKFEVECGSHMATYTEYCCHVTLRLQSLHLSGYKLCTKRCDNKFYEGRYDFKTIKNCRHNKDFKERWD